MTRRQNVRARKKFNRFRRDPRALSRAALHSTMAFRQLSETLSRTCEFFARIGA